MEKIVQISIIIINYNGRAFLKTCLGSIIEQSFPKENYEIILVDNKSSDNSVKFVENNFPSVKIIKSDINLGFAAGNNLGAKQSKSNYLVFLNTDTEVDKNWLKFLVSAVEKHSDIVAVNSKLFLVKEELKTRLIQNAGTVVFKNGYARDRGAVVKDKIQQYEEDSSYFDQPKEINAFCGASVLIRSKVFKEVGGFDESFFMYYEDVDLSLRLQRYGWKIIYEPKSIVYHIHAGTSKEWSPFFIYYTERNRLAILIKHFPVTIIISEVFKYYVLIGVTIFRALSKFDKKEKDSSLLILKKRLSTILWLMINTPCLFAKRFSINKNQKITMLDLYNKLY
jgi:GT2 family glycosyltransferase